MFITTTPSITSTTDTSTIATTPASQTAAAPVTAAHVVQKGTGHSDTSSVGPSVKPLMMPRIAKDNLAAANKIMLQAAQKNRDLSAKMASASYINELLAKVAAAKAQKAQIAGERTSAGTQLAAKVGAAGVQAGVGRQAAVENLATGPTAAVRAAQLGALAKDGAAGNLVSQSVDATDKLAGGAYQADQAKMAGKEADMQVTIASQAKTDAQGQLTQSDKAFGSALDALKGTAQRWADVISKIGG